MKTRLAGALALASIVGLLVPSSSTAEVVGTDLTYTSDADFDLGTLVSVNHDAPFNDQLQLDSPTEPFPFINVAASGRGTVVRVNTDTGETVGEYRTAPEGRGLNPSRTTVDLFGNVWTANRDEVDEIGGVPHGSAVKVGLIVGGTRVGATGEPDPTGGYLAPPFGYSTCVDRDDDGLIRTSSGLLDVLDWPDNTDGVGGTDGVIEDAVDECVLLYQRLPDAEQARHVSVDADNNVWVGGFPFELRTFHKLDGTTGAILDSFDARQFGCGGYGGLIDGNGVLWSVGWVSGEGPLLRYDPSTRAGSCVNTFGGYGLGVDTNGYVWASIWENGIVKVSPGGVVEPGFPKSTWLPPTTSAATAAFSAPAALMFEPASVTKPSVMPQMTPSSSLSTLPVAAPDEAPDFWLAPDDDWVQSMNRWTPGSTVSLTIADGTGTVYTDSQIADPSGYFNFNLGGVFDVQRGHTVTVSDGTTTKTHVVLGLFVDGINVAADTVFGRADPGTDVNVWVHDTDANLTVTADGSGNWTADFSALTDLTYASNGGSQQTDDDGDATGVWWSGPSFTVAPDDDWVQSMNRWTPGSTVSLTIADGTGTVYTDSQIADPSGNFNFNLGGVFDVQRGHTVTVSDGTTTKNLLVTNPDVTALNEATDRVSGTAEPLATLDVGAAPNPWSEASWRGVTADTTGAWTADFSVPSGGFPPIDIDATTVVSVQERDDDGDTTYRSFGPPVQGNSGVAVTPGDNHVWVANRLVGTVTRLDSDGEIAAVIVAGSVPTGVAVDASGKVWVTNLGSDNTVRIDPNGGTDGLGAIDLVVDLGEGASPYNYSDMTGAVVVGSTSPQGFWTVVQDSGEAGFEWGRITWNTESEASEPIGSEIVVEIRTSDSAAGLGGQAFVPVSDGELFSSVGRFIEVRVTLKASPDGLSPVLSDIRMQPALIEVEVDIKPGSYPNSINVKRTTGVIPVAVLGGDDFGVSTVDVSTLRFGPNQALPAHDLTNVKKHFKDVNGDGYLDLVSHYVVGETGLGVGDTEACLTGETVDGVPIEGCDSIRAFWP